MMPNYHAIYTEEFKRGDYSIHPVDEPAYDWLTRRIPIETRSLVDVGAGRGVFLRSVMTGHPKIAVSSVDVDKFHGLDIPFYKQDLTDPNGNVWTHRWEVVTCVGVLEHIHPSQLDIALKNLRQIAKIAMITVANHSDIGVTGELHLIRENMEWWNNKLSQLWTTQFSGNLHGDRLYAYKLLAK